MVNSVKNHGNYQKYKEHPLVVFLISRYREEAETTIPAVWVSFIKKSTPESDMILLSSQLVKWGVTEPLDDTLRGEELLAFISDVRLLRFLNETDTHASNTGREWPQSLEELFTHHKVIPDKMKCETYQYSDVSMRCDLNYIETGTLKYIVHRRIPAVNVSIPGQWILENCGPEHSDSGLLNNYREGQTNMFQLKGESKIKTRGFALLEKIKGMLESGTASDQFNTETMSSHLNRTFPKMIQGAQWDEEPQFSMEVFEPKPDPLKFGTDVIRRKVTFSDCMSRRGGPRITKMLFPYFTREVRDMIDRKSIRRPTSRTAFDQTVLSEDENGEMNAGYFVRQLRSIYTQLEDVRKYNDARTGIKE